MKTWTVRKIRDAKGRVKLPCLTAYDAPTAQLLDAAGLPLILVGDSLGNTALGFSDTLSVTMAHMLHHTAAVTRVVRHALVVGDMPFLACATRKTALRNAGRFLRDAQADAVKLEGGAERALIVRWLIDNGIPVMGHIGLLPQSVRAQGGYRVQGRDPEAVERLLQDAHALDQAGVFALVLECVPADVARMITERVRVPTIGIGAGPHCDGQILVTHDLLGLSPEPPPRFVKPFAHLAQSMSAAFAAYADAVRANQFPADEHSY